MSESLLVAIDGPSGSGKSTTAKLLARRLGLGYLDTGAMYRAATSEFLRRYPNGASADQVAALVAEADIVCETSPDALVRIKAERGIDIFLPSIHILPGELPYVTYWPDCQPNHAGTARSG